MVNVPFIKLTAILSPNHIYGLTLSRENLSYRTKKIFYFRLSQ